MPKLKKVKHRSSKDESVDDTVFSKTSKSSKKKRSSKSSRTDDDDHKANADDPVSPKSSKPSKKQRTSKSSRSSSEESGSEVSSKSSKTSAPCMRKPKPRSSKSSKSSRSDDEDSAEERRSASEEVRKDDPKEESNVPSMAGPPGYPGHPGTRRDRRIIEWELDKPGKDAQWRCPGLDGKVCDGQANKLADSQMETAKDGTANGGETGNPNDESAKMSKGTTSLDEEDDSLRLRNRNDMSTQLYSEPPGADQRADAKPLPASERDAPTDPEELCQSIAQCPPKCSSTAGPGKELPPRLQSREGNDKRDGSLTYARDQLRKCLLKTIAIEDEILALQEDLVRFREDMHSEGGYSQGYEVYSEDSVPPDRLQNDAVNEVLKDLTRNVEKPPPAADTCAALEKLDQEGIDALLVFSCDCKQCCCPVDKSKKCHSNCC